MKRFLRIGITLGLIAGIAGVAVPQTTSAACPALPQDRGIATATINVPADGTFVVWSRIKAPDSTNNSYLLQIDDTSCGIVVGDAAAIPAGSWTWVNYQAGNTSNTMSAALTAGSHTLQMAGREDNVQLDRVILTTDASCVPTDTGDNCAATTDTIPPSVTINSPQNGATVSGNVNINVSASDASSIATLKVFIDGKQAASVNNSSSLSFGWNTKKGVKRGSHTISAQATDPAGNTGTSTITVNK